VAPHEYFDQTGIDNYTESKGVVATNAVHHSRSQASYIVLPVIP